MRVSYENVASAVEITRIAKGITQKELSELSGVPASTLSRWEKRMLSPTSEQLQKVAEGLGVTESLLSEGCSFERVLCSSLHLARKPKPPVKVWREMEARCNLLWMKWSRLLSRFSEWHSHSVPCFDPLFVCPPEAAKLVRSQWKMPSGAVTDLSTWMETAGCLIFFEAFQMNKSDALTLKPSISANANGDVLLLVNTLASVSEMRVALAHELAHLVFHSQSFNFKAEQEAAEFAAEFLLPSEAVIPSLSQLDVDDFDSMYVIYDLVKEWGVTPELLINRAVSLNIISSPQARALSDLARSDSFALELANKGIAPERPYRVANVVEQLRSEGLTDQQIRSVAGVQQCPAEHTPGMNEPAFVAVG